MKHITWTLLILLVTLSGCGDDREDVSDVQLPSYEVDENVDRIATAVDESLSNSPNKKMRLAGKAGVAEVGVALYEAHKQREEEKLYGETFRLMAYKKKFIDALRRKEKMEIIDGVMKANKGEGYIRGNHVLGFRVPTLDEYTSLTYEEAITLKGSYIMCMPSEIMDIDFSHYDKDFQPRITRINTDLEFMCDKKSHEYYLIFKDKYYSQFVADKGTLYMLLLMANK